MLSSNSVNHPTLRLKDKTPFVQRANKFWRRQSKIIFSSMVVVGALTFAILSKIDNVYTATTLIAVDTSAGQIIVTPGNTSGFQLASSLVDSEVAILRSYETTRRAIRDVPPPPDPQSGQITAFAGLRSLISTAAARPTDGQHAETRIIMDLVERTTVERLGQSFIIGINVADTSPDRAAELANALADSHLTAQRQTSSATAQAAEATLATRVATLPPT